MPKIFQFTAKSLSVKKVKGDNSIVDASKPKKKKLLAALTNKIFSPFVKQAGKKAIPVVPLTPGMPVKFVITNLKDLSQSQRTADLTIGSDESSISGLVFPTAPKKKPGKMGERTPSWCDQQELLRQPNNQKQKELEKRFNALNIDTKVLSEPPQNKSARSHSLNDLQRLYGKTQRNDNAPLSTSTSVSLTYDDFLSDEFDTEDNLPRVKASLSSTVSNASAPKKKLSPEMVNYLQRKMTSVEKKNEKIDLQITQRGRHIKQAENQKKAVVRQLKLMKNNGLAKTDSYRNLEAVLVRQNHSIKKYDTDIKQLQQNKQQLISGFEKELGEFHS